MTLLMDSSKGQWRPRTASWLSMAAPLRSFPGTYVHTCVSCYEGRGADIPTRISCPGEH